LSDRRTPAEYRRELAKAQWMHRAPSAIVNIVTVGDFLLIVTECNGMYFLDMQGRPVPLPIHKKRW
jgi:hypothetical protein